MIRDVTDVEVDRLLTTVQELAGEGYRFVSITGVDEGDHLLLLYHFCRDLRLVHLRVRLPHGQELPSISRIYFGAFVPENELQDFFGCQVTNMVLDYRGRWLLSAAAPPHPLRKQGLTEEVPR